MLLRAFLNNPGGIVITMNSGTTLSHGSRIFLNISAVLFWVAVILVIYIYKTMPRSKVVLSETSHWTFVDKATYADINRNRLQNLFDNIYRALERNHDFAPGVPHGSIHELVNDDSVAVAFEFYLDCGCPDGYDVYAVAIDLRDPANPAAGSRVVYKKPFEVDLVDDKAL